MKWLLWNFYFFIFQICRTPALQDTQSKELFCQALPQTTTEAHEDNKKRKLNPEMCVSFRNDDSENVDTNNENKNKSIEKDPPKKRCRNVSVCL